MPTLLVVLGARNLGRVLATEFAAGGWRVAGVAHNVHAALLIVDAVIESDKTAEWLEEEPPERSASMEEVAAAVKYFHGPERARVDARAAAHALARTLGPVGTRDTMARGTAPWPSG